MVAGHSKGKLDENVTWYFDLVNVAMVLRVWMVLVFDADLCSEFWPCLPGNLLGVKVILI